MVQVTWKLIQVVEGKDWIVELKATIDSVCKGNTKEEAMSRAINELKRQIGETENEKRATG